MDYLEKFKNDIQDQDSYNLLPDEDIIELEELEKEEKKLEALLFKEELER